MWDYFEQNARNILTTWSDKDMLLNDYASRTWNGLTKTFYGERWRMFFDAVDAALDAGGKFDEEAFDRYHRAVTDFEKEWWEERVGVFPTSPTGPVRPLAAKLYKKYATLSMPKGRQTVFQPDTKLRFRVTFSYVPATISLEAFSSSTYPRFSTTVILKDTSSSEIFVTL